jgi:hypothetical protein
MTKELWFDDQQGQRPFQSSTAYKLTEVHSVQWVLGVLYPGLQQVCHKTDHSPVSSAKFINESRYTFTPLYNFMACTFTIMCITASLHCAHLA